MNQLWKALDGKKTYIGGICIFFGVFLTEVVKGFWEFDPAWMEPTIKTFNWFGMLITGGGWLDKGRKQIQGK